ncbi:MAG: carboxylesterase family protein [Oscillospiraceae bacterium]|nr:carboxylesterase family protein [Oscillospiraceae bacterium]
MERKAEPRQQRGILWRVLLVVAALLDFTILELGKHTVLGWVLTCAALIAYALLRLRALRGAGRLLRWASWLGLLAVFAGILYLSWPPVKPVPAVAGRSAGVTDVVHVAQGDLTGVLTEDGAVEVYAGIPYAQPPVGELRWREPQRAGAWDGVLAADHFAPMSMQTQNLPIYSSLTRIIGYHDYAVSLSDNYRPPVSEDSLYLNIWKPAGAASGLPVLVYIHGGSLQTGQPWYEDYSGEGLARDGVVVVNLGYRLGIFGFFADAELAAESPNGTTGNYGLLDQIMALEWVRDNIAAFGGDPDNVTLAGESAGSACVTALCTSPLAKGLFRRAVGESSTVTAPQPAHSFRLMEEALATGAETKARYGAASVSELRQISAEELAGEMNFHHHITVDGYVLTETPYESYAKGIHNEEAQLQGYNRDESAPFILFGQAKLSNYEAKVRAAFEEPYASRILALYPAATDAEARQNWAEIYTAVLFTYGHYCWERQALANGVPVYTYYFTKDNGRLGAWHSGEEVYLYGNIPDGSSLYDDADRALSAAMKGYYRNFIATGDPNGDVLPAWAPSDGAGTVLEWGEQIAPREAPYAPLYDILDEMYGYGA